ncbi:MAG: hypothetical protein QHJ34_05385 [bacterium]|jgi:hypothetical protein|nr:hypothetical protein [candidate division KSB1 bacterium]MDH7559650.1 hypothetical protein [bacterium]
MRGCSNLRWLAAICLAMLSGMVSVAGAPQKPVEEKLNKIVSDVEQKVSSRDPSVGEDAVKIILNKIEVLGRIEKPQAVFIVPGTDPRVDDIGIDRSFFQEIFRPVERDVVRKTLNRHARDYIPW